MIVLVAAALVWIGAHIGVAGSPLRAMLVARLGEAWFRGAFSVGSVLLLIGLALAYRQAPYVPLWVAPDWLRWLLALAMLPASILFVASVSGANPTAIGGESRLGGAVRGITRVTRHPMLCAFALWAAVHVLGNGDAASIVFFGAFLVTALAGMPSIDAKMAARNPAGWAPFARATSALPGAAILAGRNRLALAEIGWIVPAAAAALWLLLLFGHRHVIGVPPVPGLP